jgi:hypothetical protein
MSVRFDDGPKVFLTFEVSGKKEHDCKQLRTTSLTVLISTTDAVGGHNISVLYVALVAQQLP